MATVIDMNSTWTLRLYKFSSKNVNTYGFSRWLDRSIMPLSHGLACVQFVLKLHFRHLRPLLVLVPSGMPEVRQEISKRAQNWTYSSLIPPSALSTRPSFLFIRKSGYRLRVSGHTRPVNVCQYTDGMSHDCMANPTSSEGCRLSLPKSAKFTLSSATSSWSNGSWVIE